VKQPTAYVHGYDASESERLLAQASSVVDLLHGDTFYQPGSTVLEVGCGTGAQTVSLGRNSPHARFVSFDRSEASLDRARARVQNAGLTNVELRREDLFSLPFAPHSFDHVFVCFVLEHLPNPVEALVVLRHLIKPGGTITVFEGDHGSTYFHPDSRAAHRAIDCQVQLQRRAGGDANIGRRLYPLLVEAGFPSPKVTPRMVYVDSSRPDLVESFTRGTFTAMIQGVREQALAAGIIDQQSFDEGVRALLRTTEADGVFCYTFFKGVALLQRARRAHHLQQETQSHR
jgi:ubiquinone/menaquinone biosynthesis C-methylase UbiE